MNGVIRWSLQGNLFSYVSIPTGETACLDSQGKYGASAQVVVNTCNTGLASQAWELRDILIEQGIQGTSETACVDVKGDSIADHTWVTPFFCTLGINEHWTYINGQLQGVTTATVKTCLAEGTVGWVQLETCNGSASQTWYVQGGAGSGVAIQNGGSGNCLDSRGAYGAIQLRDNPCNGGYNQSWLLQ